MATRLHAQQQRKASGVPYVAHLLQVAGLVLEHGGSEDEAIAALLHDAVEDQGGEPTRREIQRRFGSRVADLVMACTDATCEPKPPWRPRKEEFIHRLETACDATLLLVAADKLHNATAVLRELESRGDEVWQHFRGGREGTLWYYRVIGEVLSRRLPGELTGELQRVVGRMDELASTVSR